MEGVVLSSYEAHGKGTSVAFLSAVLIMDFDERMSDAFLGYAPCGAQLLGIRP